MKYAEYLRGKSVLVVGPALYLEGKARGKEFDSYDVIVRINAGPKLALNHPEDLGTRTDVLYHNHHLPIHIRRRDKVQGRGKVTPSMVKLWSNHGVKYVVGPCPCSYRMKIAENMFKNIKEAMVEAQVEIARVFWTEDELEQWETLSGIFHSASMGLACVTHLLEQPLKRLFVVGITCMKGGYYEEYCPKALCDSLYERYKNPKAGHKPEWEEKVLCALWRRDERMVPDSPLWDILTARRGELPPVGDGTGPFRLGDLG